MNTSDTTFPVLATLSGSKLPVITPDLPNLEAEDYAKTALAELLLKELERAAQSCYVHPTLKRKALDGLSTMRSLSYDELLRELVLVAAVWSNLKSGVLPDTSRLE
jgi:hypothetical protein